MSYTLKSVLSIAGSDSSGGAGIQADIKTIQAMGLFAQTAVTALTAQNTMGVHGVLNVDPQFVKDQIKAVFDDIRPDAVKIGMVSSADIVEAIAESLAQVGARNVVLDPVMVATSGGVLMVEGAAKALVEKLFPLADVVTPNRHEAQALCGFEIRSHEDMERAAACLAQMTPGAVVVKGGHSGDDADDLVYWNGQAHWISGKRIDTENTHGTGCTLSSAIACGLASGHDVVESVRLAKSYVSGALGAGLDLGHGSGPLDHDWRERSK